MESFIHADIFFVVTTVSVVLVTIALIVALVYVIRILRNMRAMSEMLRKESAHIVEDIDGLRANIRRDGLRIGTIIQFFRNLFTKKRIHHKK